MDTEDTMGGECNQRGGFKESKTLILISTKTVEMPVTYNEERELGESDTRKIY